MTSKEAIKTLKAIIHIIPNEYYNEETEGALHMAIKALEQEPIFNKIRSEIDSLIDPDALGDYQRGFNYGAKKAIQIIDKYKEDKA